MTTVLTGCIYSQAYSKEISGSQTMIKISDDFNCIID